jgi:hypothetical protein
MDYLTLFVKNTLNAKNNLCRRSGRDTLYQWFPYEKRLNLWSLHTISDVLGYLISTAHADPISSGLSNSNCIVLISLVYSCVDNNFIFLK